MAPELQAPPEFFLTQLKPLSHWSAAEQGLAAPPLEHVPWIEPAVPLPQKPLWHCCFVRQLAPSEPSLHWPTAPASELTMQIALSQSDLSKQAERLLPSLQVPTNEVGGRMQSRPSPQCAATLHEAPLTPV